MTKTRRSLKTPTTRRKPVPVKQGPPAERAVARADQVENDDLDVNPHFAPDPNLDELEIHGPHGQLDTVEVWPEGFTEP